MDKFTGNDYFSASISRSEDLIHLLKKKESVIFAIYCAGVAIECMLRAYIVKNTSEFDSKHDLEKLYEKSQIALTLSVSEKSELSTAIKKANRIWYNNLRYTSEKRMKRLVGHEFAKTAKHKNINNYVSKYFSDIFKATELIISKGKEKWN